MQAISRRAVLRLAAVASAAVALPFEWTQSSWAATRSTSSLATTSHPGKLSRIHFARFVGSTMRMTGGGHSRKVVLAAVDDIAAAPARDPNRFAVLFRTRRSSAAMPQGVYRFRHSTFGSVDLFVVPVDRGVRARYYQAVINRPS